MKEDIFYLLSILGNNGGFTIKKYNIVAYKTGWQVATNGIETKDIEVAKKLLKATMVLVVYGLLMGYITLTFVNVLAQKNKLSK